MAKLCLPETRCCIHGSTDLHFKRKVIPCPKPSEDSTLHTSSFSLFLFSGCMMIVEKWPKTYASCFGYPQCLGLSRSYDQWPMHFCKALFWKIALDKSVCQMPKCKCNVNVRWQRVGTGRSPRWQCDWSTLIKHSRLSSWQGTGVCRTALHWGVCMNETPGCCHSVL